MSCFDLIDTDGLYSGEFKKIKTKFALKLNLIDHEHVNTLVRVEHVSGPLLTNDAAEALGVVLGVEDSGREGFGAHVSPRIRQKVTVVAVVLGEVGQLVEDQVVDAADLVP